MILKTVVTFSAIFSFINRAGTKKWRAKCGQGNRNTTVSNYYHLWHVKGELSDPLLPAILFLLDCVYVPHT